MTATNEQRIADALVHIDPDDRDQWLRMGMAIKSEMGDAGFDAWNEWSQQSPAYRPSDAKATWKSIKPTGGVTLGTLFYEAKANGWSSTERFTPPTHQQLEEQRKQREDRERQDKAEIDKERAQTKAHAKLIRAKARPASVDHPYLQRKSLESTDTLQEIDASEVKGIVGYAPQAAGEPLAGRLLVVPIKQGDDMATVELIDESGRKAGLYGRGTRTGGYWATRRLPDGEGKNTTILIGEGMATVLSASQAAGSVGVAALSAHNVVNVTRIMRQQYPYADLVVLADIQKSDGSPDPRAVKAAIENNARLAVPEFGDNRSPDQTDFNDMMQCVSLYAVDQSIKNALVPDATEGASAADGPMAQLVCASDITPEAMDWIWDGWLAAGKMHILGGAPETGKTTIAMALAATVSIGGRWPDGTRAEAGNVVIWSGEDGLKDTLVPRLLASGADTTRVHFVGEVVNDGRVVSFDPATHMSTLRHALRRIGGVKLLIVDPVVSAVGGDDHKNSSVRRGLQPLVDLAIQEHCAALGITHFTKGTAGRDPLERITGSLAFGALARLVMVAAKHQEQTDDGQTKRILCRAKSNLGPSDGGFEYDLNQEPLRQYEGVVASRVLWGNSIEGGARNILAAADATADDDNDGSLDDAVQFLRDLLSDGPLTAKQVWSDANGAGFSRHIIQSAQKRLKIKPRKEGSHNSEKPNRWVWALPEIGHQNHGSTDAGNGHFLQSKESTGQILSFGEDSCGFPDDFEAKKLRIQRIQNGGKLAQNEPEEAKNPNTVGDRFLAQNGLESPVDKGFAKGRHGQILSSLENPDRFLENEDRFLAPATPENDWDDDSEEL